MFGRVFGWYLAVSGWPDLFGDLHQLLGITIIRLVFAMALGEREQTRAASSRQMMLKQIVDTPTTTPYLGAYEPIGTLPRRHTCRYHATPGGEGGG